MNFLFVDGSCGSLTVSLTSQRQPEPSKVIAMVRQ